MYELPACPECGHKNQLSRERVLGDGTYTTSCEKCGQTLFGSVLPPKAQVGDDVVLQAKSSHYVVRSITGEMARLQAFADSKDTGERVYLDYWEDVPRSACIVIGKHKWPEGKQPK